MDVVDVKSCIPHAWSAWPVIELTILIALQESEGLHHRRWMKEAVSSGYRKGYHVAQKAEQDRVEETAKDDILR